MNNEQMAQRLLRLAKSLVSMTNEDVIATEFVRGNVSYMVARCKSFSDSGDKLYKLVVKKDKSNNKVISKLASEMSQDVEKIERELKKVKNALSMITGIAK